MSFALLLHCICVATSKHCGMLASERYGCRCCKQHLCLTFPVNISSRDGQGDCTMLTARLCEAGNNKGTGRRRPQQVGHQSCARQGKPFVMIEILYEQVAWHQGCPPAQPRPEPHRLLHKHTTCTLLQSHEGRLTPLSRCSPGAQRQRRTPACQVDPYHCI